MQFELDNTLIDDILFHMENQDGNFVLDCQKGIVVDTYNNEDEPDWDDERFISLPKWDSAAGYRLMEKFAAGLKNPVARQELSNALNKNKGVFRAYRDILEQYPEIEKLWFNFKEQKMKNEVILWYNALREEWGLKPVGIEPEDDSSLVLEDFDIREEGKYNLKAHAANGDIAGTINADLNDGVLHINTLEVRAEYRGMGIGKTLLAKLLEKADVEKLDITIDIPADMDFFCRSLLLENFKCLTQRFIRKID